MATDEKQIRDLLAEWMAATKAGDVDRVLELMTDDALFLTAGNAPMTRADFEKVARSQVTSRMEIDGTLDVHEVRISGDQAFAWSHLSVNVRTPGQEEPVERVGHVLTVFFRRDGRWRLARDANLLVPARK